MGMLKDQAVALSENLDALPAFGAAKAESLVRGGEVGCGVITRRACMS